MTVTFLFSLFVARSSEQQIDGSAAGVVDVISCMHRCILNIDVTLHFFYVHNCAQRSNNVSGQIPDVTMKLFSAVCC